MLRRLPVCATLALTSLLLSSAPVLAHDGGEGLYGETNDKVITEAGFMLIIFFPLFLLFMSLIQWQLEKRKYRRKSAEKTSAPITGGW